MVLLCSELNEDVEAVLEAVDARLEVLDRSLEVVADIDGTVSTSPSPKVVV